MNRGAYLIDRSRNRHFNRRGLKPRPALEIVERNIDAVIFRGARLDHTSGSKANGVSLETERERFILRRQDRRCTDPDQRWNYSTSRLRPARY